MKNIITIDFECGDSWEFYEEFKKLDDVWEIDKCISNFSQKNKIGVLRRYIKYFTHSFNLFLRRKQIANLIAWQQFYGIIFCWLMSFFNVKPITNVTILTFIFKEKKGFLGNLYKRFIANALRYKGLNNVIVLSSYEVEEYSKTFPESKEKFKFTKLGISSKKIDYVSECSENFVLSAGRSNRDYNFLIEVFKLIPNIKCKILCDNFEYTNLPNNIEIFNNVFGNDYYKMIIDSKLTFVPLNDNKISSGQLFVLDSHKYNKFSIVTSNPGINDYVINDVNGYIVEKDCTRVARTIEYLFYKDNIECNFEPYYEKYYARSVIDIIYKKEGSKKWLNF